ncbi:hematopoietic progenitor cell antigen CD34 [Tiliqua scincoides]|uniref:hematopoietic progenitor cell antigen CD34 n=1 Tax=Tiliqua scincoides TaxID=71010 RepID=UPI00346312A4
MTLLWNFKAMKGRQLLWTAVLSWTFCVLTLLGNQVAGQNTTVLTSTSTVSKLETTSSPTKEVTQNSSITANTPATTSVSPENLHVTKENLMTNATSSPTTLSELLSTTMNQTTQPAPAQENTSHAANNGTDTTITSNIFPTSTSTEKPMFSDSLTPTKAGSSSVTPNLTCVDIKQVTSSKVICLELNEPYSCQKFVQEKGAHLAKVICGKNQTSCTIQLTKSNMNHKCILVVQNGNKETTTGTSKLGAVLQMNKSSLKEQAITLHREEVIENHFQKSPSRKTLIALVTSGLLLAFLGLTAYFLMKRRSWSPMGERLGEDPYYTENGSHDNTVASHEQSDLQDKPNLNGGSRENGTGQSASKNGHSTRPHVVADTEL